MPRTIEVVPHRTEWFAEFEREALLLRSVFGMKLIDIHHVGSTAVPGLSAKPIIDILVVLDETDTVDRFSPAMEALGYRPRGQCLDATAPGTPGRFYFSKDGDVGRTHQVHVCALGHRDVAAQLAFRDYLRAHPSEAAAYGELKERVAAKNRHDIVGYMRGKDAFVKAALEAAMAWHSALGAGSGGMK